ncbi:MAG: SDR family NAD(P)-dependent oxidoreductase [Paracoccus sp. (in: a-proteobacteria)]
MTDIRFDFDGRTALVTGAASGIGRAIALELGASGAMVVVSDLDADACRPVVDEIAVNGGTACLFPADVSDESAMQALVEFAQAQGGDLHMAVNNAGIGGPSLPTGEYPAEDWRRIIDINLNGVFYGMRWQIPALLRAGGGSIVNMSSILGSVGFANAAPYVAAKHGLLGLTRTAAMEYAPQGVRVNAVGPAFIDTPLLSANLTPEALQALAGMHPMGRIGTVEEVSGLVCFLLSHRASFITGSYHLVDGGYTAP